MLILCMLIDRGQYSMFHGIINDQTQKDLLVQKTTNEKDKELHF